MKIPKQCPVCSFRNFKETPKKITCELCGWFMWKNPNRQKANSLSNSKSSLKRPLHSNPNNSRGAKYFQKKESDVFLNRRERFKKKYKNNMTDREVV